MNSDMAMRREKIKFVCVGVCCYRNTFLISELFSGICFPVLLTFENSYNFTSCDDRLQINMVLYWCFGRKGKKKEKKTNTPEKAAYVKY